MNEPVLDAAQQKMRADIAADRLHTRGIGHLPIDRESAAWEITEEERTLRDSRPKTRRWKALDKFDRKVDQAKQRQAAAAARVQESEQARAAAPQDDARSLADWLAGGQKGERPSPALYERERERDAAKLLVEAATMELDRALERRMQHIVKHRQKMLEDVQRDVEAARQELLAQVRAIPALRQALVDARANLLWAAAYPAHVESFGFESATAMGLQAPIMRLLGTKARIEFTALMQTFEEDAAAVAAAFSATQKKQLGIAVERTPVSEAMWDNDEDNIAWRKRELKRAQELGRWSMDINSLAAEASYLRPDPPEIK